MGLLRAGQDRAGGMILPNISIGTVLCNGKPIAVLGSLVVPHGSSKTPHGHFQKLITADHRRVLVGGKPVCRTGDVAGCGHPGVPGSPNVGI